MGGPGDPARTADPADGAYGAGRAAADRLPDATGRKARTGRLPHRQPGDRRGDGAPGTGALSRCCRLADLADPLALMPARRLRRLVPDFDRLPNADREPRQPDDQQPDDEEDRARRRVGEPALDPDEVAHPAGRSGHAMEEQAEAADDAAEAKH